MPVRLNGATSGSVTLNVPSVAGTNTLIIPAETGTVVTSSSQGFFQPAGSVIFHAANTAPQGYLKANGAAVSRTVYAALFAAIGTTFGVGDGSTTFNLPDLRGFFPRGWDDGAGVDTGRSFGSTQTAYAGYNTFVGSLDDGDSQTGSFTSITNLSVNGTNVRNGTYQIDNVAGDTRPRNVALLACIKF